MTRRIRISRGQLWIAPLPVEAERTPWMLKAALLLGLIVWVFAFIGVRSVFGLQVDAVLQLHGRDAEMRVQNPTKAPLRVSVTLFRDSTLTDSVPARISPSAFTLDPGVSQIVRLRLQEPIKPGAALRLATLFMPVAEAKQQATMRIVLASRIITRVQAGP